MKLKIFCRCIFFPSWSGYGLISTPVLVSDIIGYIIAVSRYPTIGTFDLVERTVL